MKTAKTTTKGTAPLTVLPPEPSGAGALVTADFERARKYWRASELHGHAMAACMVFLGLELIALHKRYGIKRGGDRRSADQTRNVASLIAWPELVEKEMGFSHDTARRFMMMAEAAKSRIKALNSEELLNTPPLLWPEDKQKKLIASVRKITDGHTANQLMLDWGITKKPKAGNGGNNSSDEEDDSSEDTDTRSLEQRAQDDLWPLEEAIGCSLLDSNFEAFVHALPLEPDLDREIKCSLTGLEKQLRQCLEVVTEAKRHVESQQRKPKKRP